MPLMMGAASPVFSARTHARPDFAFSSLGGFYILVAFLPPPGPARDAANRAIAEHRRLFDDKNRLFFGVVRDESDFLSLTPEEPGIRYFHDPEGYLSQRFGLETPDGETLFHWVLIDPMMRVMSSRPIGHAAQTFSEVALCEDTETHAGVPVHAPVLIVPRVFESEFCRRLIQYFETSGGQPSGVMREIDGRTVGVMDNTKRRRDAMIEDEVLRGEVRHRLAGRLLPQISRAFMFDVTRAERYVVARYDAADGGFFRRHRDNTTKGTAHRQFACSINLNADEFEGGDLKFPEFGEKTYRPPSGGAVIFSCALLHEATPVTKGTRYAFLPFFYNDAAEKIREANMGFLGAASRTEAA